MDRNKPDSPQPDPVSTGEGLDSIVRHLRQRLQPIEPSELLVATADDADPPIEAIVPALLATIRQALGMDVVFISEFVGGQRVFKHADVPSHAPVIVVGHADPLEASWCQRVIDGRLPRFIPDASVHFAAGDVAPAPFPIGTHLSVPIVLADGQAFGTLCCFSFQKNPAVRQADLALLDAIARLLAAGENRRRSAT